MRHRPPGVEQLLPEPLGQHFLLTDQAHDRRGDGLADPLRAMGQVMAIDEVGESGAIFRGNLHDCPQLFVEQASQGIVAPGIEIQLQAHARGKRHFAERGKGAAIGTIVVSQQQLVGARRLDQFEESAQARRLFKVRRDVSEAAVALAQHAAAQALQPGAEADQPQFGIKLAVEHGRQLVAHIGHACESADDQRHRRHRLGGIASRILPLRLHRQGVLAHGDADVEVGAQLHADRLHRVVQQGVFAIEGGGRHPVG